jgi:hypothetical protein
VDNNDKKDDQFALQASGDVSIASAVARVQAEIQAQIMVAQRFRRSESQARQDLLTAIKASPRLAEKCSYQYPRGTKWDAEKQEFVPNVITGPSVYLAREAARTWGNIDVGTEIILDNERERKIRSYAWDMQTNTRQTAEAWFQKLVQRSKTVTKNGKKEKITEWISPDERDLRELTNKYGSIGERNCILKVVPSHVIDEAQDAARNVTKEEAAKNPEVVRAKIADAFLTLGISVQMIEEDYLGHSLKQTTPEEMARLRGVFTSIRDGDSSWEEFRLSILPSAEQVPELPILRDLAKQLKWNDARLATEIGRNQSDIGKLVESMREAVAKQSPQAASATSAGSAQANPQSSTTEEQQQNGQASQAISQQPTGEVISPQSQRKEPPKSKLGKERDF